jgi:hypothetical protein
MEVIKNLISVILVLITFYATIMLYTKRNELTPKQTVAIFTVGVVSFLVFCILILI